MAKSYSAEEIQNKAVKHKLYCKFSLDEDIEALLKKQNSLKACFVPLVRIDAETRLNNSKCSSQASKQNMAIPFTENDEVNSKLQKMKSINLDKCQKTYIALKKSISSKDSVKYSQNASACSSFLTVCDHTTVKSCYVKLERLHFPVKQCSPHLSEKIEDLSPFHNAVVGCSYNEIQNSFGMKMPCSERRSRSVCNESVSDMNQAAYSPCDQLKELDDSINGSFISARLLSTPSSTVNAENTQKIVDLNDSSFDGSSATTGVNKKSAKENSHLHLKPFSAKRKKIYFVSSSSDLDSDKEVTTLDNNQNSVKRSEKRSSVHCSDKEIKESEALKCCVSRNAKSVCNGSECSTEENFQMNIRVRKSAFIRRRHKKCRKSQTERDRSHFDSNDDSSNSTVFNNRLATTNSYKGKTTTSGLLYNESDNDKREQKCNASFKYNLKPCHVLLVKTEEEFNNLHPDSSKAAEIDSSDLNCSEQINSSKRTKMSNRYKSMKQIKRNGSFGNIDDFISEKECRVHTNSDYLSGSEKSHTEKCNDCATTNSGYTLQDSGNKCSQVRSLSKHRKKPVRCISDSSDSSVPDIPSSNAMKRLDCTLNSGNDDSATENYETRTNDKEMKVVSEDDDETHVATDIEIASSRNCSPVNGESDQIVKRIIFDDPDCDDAYLADADEESDATVHFPENVSSVSENKYKTSAVSSVNRSENESEGKNIPKKIPYCCLGSRKVIEKNFEDIFLFRSKTNGCVYAVDIFEYENIKKMFVTIKLSENPSNNHCDKNNSPTVSESIKALDGFNKVDMEISQNIFYNFGRSQHVSSEKYLGKENLSQSSISNVVRRDEILNTKCSESSDATCSEPGPSYSKISQCEDFTLSNTNSDSSDQTYYKYDNHCNHCNVTFSSKRENYYHTCSGKLQKGFLCIYCERIFPSYSKYLSDRELHFI